MSQNGNHLDFTDRVAIAGLTRATAVEFAPAGIRVDAVAPGPIETEMYDRFATDDETKEMIESMVPMGRPGQAREIADAVAWLAHPSAGYVTGQVLAVDGGFVAQ